MRRPYDPDRHHRRSIRLKGYDYTQAGAYFITVVTRGRECLFGVVVDGQMQLNDAGRIVQETWADIPADHPGVEVDAFTVMPNHIHGIVVLTGPVGAQFIAPPTQFIAPTPRPYAMNQGAINRAPTLGGDPGGMHRAPTVGDVVRAFKARVTVAINRRHGVTGTTVWQRNYYEHVIRNEEVLNRIRQYIADNPLRWAYDRENSLSVEPEPEDAWRA